MFRKARRGPDTESDGCESLLVRCPGQPDLRVDLDADPLLIGRGQDNRLILPDDFVSTAHAEIVWHKGRHRVRDLGSTNGTALNDRPLKHNSRVELADGDVLRMGSCELVYCAANGGDGAEEPDEEPREAGPGAGLLPGLVRLVVGLAVALALIVGLAWVAAPPRLTLLVLGSDARPDEVRRGQPGRTDTLLTVIADRPPAGVTMVSLPRDLWVPIAGQGEERINTAFALGGPQSAKRSVGDVLGLPIDRYLLVGLQGVRDLVDASGGIEVDVPTAIHDAAYPTDDYRTIVVDIPAGRQRMDGETALRYARSRHQDSDFARVSRQQQVLVALRSTMLQPRNWWRLPVVLEAARRATQTDLGPLELVALTLSLVGDPAEPERLAVAPPLVEPFSGQDGAYLLRPLPALRHTVAALLEKR